MLKIDFYYPICPFFFVTPIFIFLKWFHVWSANLENFLLKLCLILLTVSLFTEFYIKVTMVTLKSKFLLLFLSSHQKEETFICSHGSTLQDYSNMESVFIVCSLYNISFVLILIFLQKQLKESFEQVVKLLRMLSEGSCR